MKKNFIVYTEDISQTRSLADQLRAIGMEVESMMEEIGVISGVMPEEAKESVAKLPGVKVEESGEFQLPPPEADIQ